MESTASATQSGHSLLDSALAYAKSGWPIFPLKSRDKIPLTVRGFKDATTDESTIRAWWSRWPDANIGLPTGAAAGVAVIDIDPRHGGDQSLDFLLGQHGELPNTRTCQTGGGGKHLYFTFVPGFRNSAGKLGAGIDTRGDGGYVVLPPSIHATGQEYCWQDEDEQSIATLPDWLHPGLKNGTPQLAAGNLAFVAGPAKANGNPVAPGGRNNAAASLAGQYIRSGDSISDVLRKVREWNQGNPEPLPEAEIDRTVASVVRTHVDKNPGAEVRIADPIAPAPLLAAKKEIPKLPDELLDPPGFVGHLCRWINETAIKPQPVLVLGNALAFFGAVIGRKVRTHTDLRSNLYVLGVGESGCGKDHSRKSIKRICESAGLTQELLGGEEVSSDSAILAAVHSHPSILFQFDEVGHFLANANSRYAAVHQKNIAPTFTKLFSSAGTTYIGKEYAGGRARQDVVQPNVCLYGTTVSDRLYGGLTPGEISDGFLGRMIVFQSDNADPIDRKVKSAPVPEAIVTQVQAWWNRQDLPQAEGNIASLIQHIPITVPMEPEAEAEFDRFGAVCRDRKTEMRGKGGLDVLWSRAKEHAMKVALIVSCGCEYQSPIISGQVAAYATALIDFQVSALITVVGDSVAGSDYERSLLLVKRSIQEAGDSGIGRSRLLRTVRVLRAQQLTECLNHLLESGEVYRRYEKNVKGPVSVVYVSN